VAVTLLGERDREEEMRRVIGLGAQLIETDHPDVVARVAGGVLGGDRRAERDVAVSSAVQPGAAGGAQE
jgi:hypothetical protein